MKSQPRRELATSCELLLIHSRWVCGMILDSFVGYILLANPFHRGRLDENLAIRGELDFGDQWF
jgi:hypothetical protein